MTCKSLDKKPKVFFINSCIGNVDRHTFNSVAGDPSANLEDDTLKDVSHKRDLLAVFSTEQESQAGHDPGNGTHFVEALIDSVRQNHNNKDVLEIVTEAIKHCQTTPVKNKTLEYKLFWRTRLLEDFPGMAVPPDQIGKRLLQVYKTPDQSPERDIVLFHGYEFGGKGPFPAALSSWFTKSLKPVCWPLEWLPRELGIPMRVFCVKYSESIYNPEPCSSKRTLKELAGQVRKDLEELATTPLIFIAHGLGGLLIQEILNSEDGYVQRLKDWLRGVVFYGVPYDFHSDTKEKFSLHALENTLKEENGHLSVVERSEIEDAVMDPVGAHSKAIKAARKKFCLKYKGITLSFEEGKETHDSKINLETPGLSYATQVNTIFIECCSRCSHFDICRPTSLKEDSTGTFTSLLRFIRKQLHNSDIRDIVGQDVHFKKLKDSLMTRGTEAAAFAGITGVDTFAVAGMGGIGKTTLAKQLYEDKEIKDYYDHRVYWIGVKKNPSIIDSQRRLIYEICNEMPSETLDTAESLLEELRRKLSERKRVLLFLDDVWEKEHVDRLLGDSFMKTLPPESKCIITSRKPQELEKLDKNAHIEKLDVLKNKDAKKLFCSKAFLNKRMPTDDKLKVVVEEVIDACGNLPILLASLGAERWGKKDIQSWVIVRDRLKQSNEMRKMAEKQSDDEPSKYDEVIEQLRISYDDLPEGNSESGDGINFKDYFLDFAAFPEREEIEIAVLMDMWTKPGLTEDGAYRILEELEQRSLVKIDGYWCHVHDLFRALAVKVDEELPLEKKKRLFAWGLSNSRLPENWINIPKACREDLVAFETEKMVIARSELEKFDSEDIILFKHLTRLRMLILMSNLNLVGLPQEIGCLTSLEKLDLSWCLGLRQLPREIGQLENLQKLNMAGCCSLTSIPRELGKLKKLLELNMLSCGLVELPVEIGDLTSLTFLCLNDCNQLKVLPEELGKLSNLEKLECDMLEIREIPKTFGDLSKLTHISFSASRRITEIPKEFGKLRNLKTLWCINAARLKVIPKELDELATEAGSLRVFNVYATGVIHEDLPTHLKALPLPWDGNIIDPEVDSTADDPDGPFWGRRRGMLVNFGWLYDPSNKEERQLAFGVATVVTLAKEPFLSPRFTMAIRIMFTMANHAQTRHAILKYGGIPILLRCIAERSESAECRACRRYAINTLFNMCVTISTHRAVVDAQGLDILTRALHRIDDVGRRAFQLLTWIMGGDKKEKDFTFTSEIYEKCGHTLGHGGCACIFCQHAKKTFLSIKKVSERGYCVPWITNYKV